MKKKRQLHPSMSIRRSVLCTAVVVVHELVQGSPIHCLDIIQGIFQTRVELIRLMDLVFMVLFADIYTTGLQISSHQAVK